MTSQTTRQAQVRHCFDLTGISQRQLATFRSGVSETCCLVPILMSRHIAIKRNTEPHPIREVPVQHHPPTPNIDKPPRFICSYLQFIMAVRHMPTHRGVGQPVPPTTTWHRLRQISRTFSSQIVILYIRLGPFTFLGRLLHDCNACSE